MPSSWREFQFWVVTLATAIAGTDPNVLFVTGPALDQDWRVRQEGGFPRTPRPTATPSWFFGQENRLAFLSMPTSQFQNQDCPV